MKQIVKVRLGIVQAGVFYTDSSPHSWLRSVHFSCHHVLFYLMFYLLLCTRHNFTVVHSTVWASTKVNLIHIEYPTGQKYLLELMFTKLASAKIVKYLDRLKIASNRW